MLSERYGCSNSNIDDGWIPLGCLRVCAGSLSRCHDLLGHWVMVNVISNTCALPAVCCEADLLHEAVQRRLRPVYHPQG